MLKTKGEETGSFFGDFIYDQVIPKDHFLVKLSQVVDFTFVNEVVKDLYCEDFGRPAYPPEQIFKMLFLEKLHDVSDVEIVKMCQTEMAFRWFIGLSLVDDIPDDSTLVRFRSRLGGERFREVFERILKMAKEKGLFLKKRLVIVDSTAIPANVDVNRIREDHQEAGGNYLDKNSPDPEASIGHKSPKKTFYGYKGHLTMDTETELITDIRVTTGRDSDQGALKALVRGDKRQAGGERVGVVGDKGYFGWKSEEIISSCQRTSFLVPRSNSTHPVFTNRQKQTSFQLAKRLRGRIEHKFAEMKHRHGMRKAIYWSRAKVALQVCLTALVVNCKRLVKLIFHPPPKLRGVVSPLRMKRA